MGEYSGVSTGYGGGGPPWATRLFIYLFVYLGRQHQFPFFVMSNICYVGVDRVNKGRVRDGHHKLRHWMSGKYHGGQHYLTRPFPGTQFRLDRKDSLCQFFITASTEKRAYDHLSGRQ